jgi:hypothetical protein
MLRCVLLFAVLFVVVTAAAGDPQPNDSDDKEEQRYLISVRCLLVILVAVLAAGIMTFFGVATLLWLVGLGPLGPVAGSWAAWFQSAYGTVWLFSFLQSVAMTTAAAKAGVAVGVGTTIYFTSAVQFDACDILETWSRWVISDATLARFVEGACTAFIGAAELVGANSTAYVEVCQQEWLKTLVESTLVATTRGEL